MPCAGACGYASWTSYLTKRPSCSCSAIPSSPPQAAVIAEYSVNRSGAGFNFLGISLHVPFSIVRRLCELPLVPAPIRDACIRAMGVMHRLAASETRLFCSQLVLQAYLPPCRRASDPCRSPSHQPRRHPAHARGRRALGQHREAAALRRASEIAAAGDDAGVARVNNNARRPRGKPEGFLPRLPPPVVGIKVPEELRLRIV
jgi:hypothetical protein